MREPSGRISRASEIGFAENFGKPGRPTLNSRNVDSFRRRDVARTNQRILISLVQIILGDAIKICDRDPGGFFIIRGHWSRESRGSGPLSVRVGIVCATITLTELSWSHRVRVQTRAPPLRPFPPCPPTSPVIDWILFARSTADTDKKWEIRHARPLFVLHSRALPKGCFS